MRAASEEQPAVAAEEAGGDVGGEAAGGGQPWKKFVYVEPSRRVKEILEEELHFQKEACHIKYPAAVTLEGIWSVKKEEFLHWKPEHSVPEQKQFAVTASILLKACRNEKLLNFSAMKS